MSHFPYGAYISTTPRVQSSGFIFDKNSAHSVSHHSKLQQRSATKSPEAPKKSPVKKIKKPSKLQLDANLKGLLSPVENKQSQLHSPTKAASKKKCKRLKGNRKKSNSPTRELLYSNLENTRKLPVQNQVTHSNIDTDFTIKPKSNSVVHQDLLNNPSYEAEFANWLSKRVQSSKNANSKTYGAPKNYNSEFISPKYDESSTHSHNIWPDAKLNQKAESLSYRQSLEVPSSVKALKKSLQGQLAGYSGQNDKRNLDLFAIHERRGDLAKPKINTPKESFSSKEQQDTTTKLTHKITPRTQDTYASPLAAQNLNLDSQGHQMGKFFKENPSSAKNTHFQGDSENFVTSTRSVAHKHENRFHVDPNTEENEGNGQNVKRIHSSSQPSKEALANEGREFKKFTDGIISKLLKRNQAKDIKVNPNAKFLLLRKQVQEKRIKQNFKSADWNAPDQMEGFNENYESISTEQSPNKVRRSYGGKEAVGTNDNNSTNQQLCQILNKTKKVLATYKDKENTWQQEKKQLVAEIKHLRSVIENI